MTYQVRRAQTLNQVEEILAHEDMAAEAPRVLWAGLEETQEDFAARCKRLQKEGSFRILAAVPYGWYVARGVQRVEFPEKHFRLLHPDIKTRYRVASGGRGSAKSHSFATALVLRLLERRTRLLCAREIQTSLLESAHQLLSDKIEDLGLSAFFSVTKYEINCTLTASDTIFKGVANNTQTLKSLEGVKICWLEEAESISARSFEILIPTIREEDSEIWISLNPDLPEAPAMAYVDSDRDDVEHIHVTFENNPWFTRALEAERAYMQRTDADAYAHVWLGHTRTHSDAQVFQGKYAIEAFEPYIAESAPEDLEVRQIRDIMWRLDRMTPDLEPKKSWDGPYLGADFGFNDPTAAVMCWINQNVLYIEHEAYEIKCDLDDTPGLFDRIPNARKHVMRADNSRPDSISYLRRHGYPKIVPCVKGKNSVEEGVAFMGSFARIVVHPRCTHVAEEMRLYSYRVDKLSGDVMPDLVDKWNHTIDSVRYALEPVVKNRGRATITRLRM